MEAIKEPFQMAIGHRGIGAELQSIHPIFITRCGLFVIDFFQLAICGNVLGKMPRLSTGGTARDSKAGKADHYCTPNFAYRSYSHTVEAIQHRER
ncbi:hypothetical protein [Hyphomicrobium sp. ghe19]|uniref:hypothetical protein n=1 Tax=Hyphomicrobium sp. ghe19 TaxID=2682968 RepID=UPI0013678186|nr:hypothetical protein HYPP_01144 [Hyphomicrobium sp. ghe19]